ncbi:hypothetical protein INR49_024158 [Caranx melampygus]|nr:hypothetical protein INR49_024158 [Caranx melampygus]
MREEGDICGSQQVVSVWVRDPRIQKNDFWHAYIDYEICLHTDSVCFTKKTSSVRRSLNNAQQITERMKGLQKFLEQILQSPLLLSDSCLHLFLQSDLSVSKIQACAAGRTHYSVAQAVQSCGLRRFHYDEDLQKDLSMCCPCDSDSDSSECRDPEPQIKDLATDKAESSASLDLMGTSQEETLSSSFGSM